jgi:flagellar biosynthesis/type III secretory pathway chaperone
MQCQSYNQCLDGCAKIEGCTAEIEKSAGKNTTMLAQKLNYKNQSRRKMQNIISSIEPYTKGAK